MHRIDRPEEDDANRDALNVLAGNGPLAAFAPTARTSACPHCHEQFGQSSLAIHTRRCRAIDAVADSSVEATDSVHSSRSRKKRPVPSLIDSCLRVITKNFQAVCMDTVYSQPSHEAALLEALPSHLVHRIISNLVTNTKKLKSNLDQERRKVRELDEEGHQLEVRMRRLRGYQTACQAARRENAVLSEQKSSLEQLLESMQRECAQYEGQVKKLQREQLAMEKQSLKEKEKRNALVHEKEVLKQQVAQAKTKEMNTLKRLAAENKKTPRRNGQVVVQTLQSKGTTPKLHKRRRDEASSIPMPSDLPKGYLNLLHASE